MKISIIKILDSTMADGEGLRTSIYCAGCDHRCPNCHNPQTWNINNGIWSDVEYIYNRIMQDPYTNITFTGGDPMKQVEGFTELAKMIKENSNKTIWLYTGYTYEEILESDRLSMILPYIDVLVDGKYKEEERDLTLRFRGSRNQRIIYLKK